MRIYFKNFWSKESVEFIQANEFKDKVFEIVEYNENSACLEVENITDDEIIEYIKIHFKSWKCTIVNGDFVFISDSFKLSPFAFCCVNKKDLENSINIIIENEDYWLFGDQLVKPEGREWKTITEQLKSKLSNGEIKSYDKIEDYLIEECKKVYDAYDADINVCTALPKCGYGICKGK